MESVVASNITEHINKHDLSNRNQWGYKKGFSTELLMSKMTENWRKALDRKQVVCVVFVDFHKAFDAIPHVVLLNKLQSAGIAGDLLLWITDYLTGRYQRPLLMDMGQRLCM